MKTQCWRWKSDRWTSRSRCWLAVCCLRRSWLGPSAACVRPSLSLCWLKHCQSAELLMAISIFFYMHIIKAAELIEHIELFLHLMHFLEVIRGGSSCPKSFRSLLEACGCFQLLCRNTKTGSIHFFLTTKPEIELFSITWQRKQVETQRGEDSLLSVFSTLLWFKTGRGCRSSEVREPEVSHSDHQLHVAFVYLWAPVYLSLLSLARGNVMFCISLLSCLCLASCFPDKDVEILGSLSSKCSKQR